MPHPDLSVPPGTVPLVLRKVTADRLELALDVARAAPPSAPVEGVWWELVDTAAPPDQPAAGVVHTRIGPDGVAEVLDVAVGKAPGADLVGQLVRELVVALRRTPTHTVRIHSDDAGLTAVLVAEGFAPAGRSESRLELAL